MLESEKRHVRMSKIVLFLSTILLVVTIAVAVHKAHKHHDHPQLHSDGPLEEHKLGVADSTATTTTDSAIGGAKDTDLGEPVSEGKHLQLGGDEDRREHHEHHEEGAKHHEEGAKHHRRAGGKLCGSHSHSHSLSHSASHSEVPTTNADGTVTPPAPHAGAMRRHRKRAQLATPMFVNSVGVLAGFCGCSKIARFWSMTIVASLLVHLVIIAHKMHHSADPHRKARAVPFVIVGHVIMFAIARRFVRLAQVAEAERAVAESLQLAEAPAGFCVIGTEAIIECTEMKSAA